MHVTGIGKMTPTQLLQECPTNTKQRHCLWPALVPLLDKLYVNVNYLAFFKYISVKIEGIMKRNQNKTRKIISL